MRMRSQLPLSYNQVRNLVQLGQFYHSFNRYRRRNHPYNLQTQIYPVDLNRHSCLWEPYSYRLTVGTIFPTHYLN